MADAFADTFGPHRGQMRVAVATDGSAAVLHDDRHPYGVDVELRDNDGEGMRFKTRRYVGLADSGAVDVDAAIAAAEASSPGAVYQDWAGV